MLLRVTVIASLFLTSPSLLAEAPLNQVLVTPRNVGKVDFSVVLSAKGKSRSFNVYAPPRTDGNCIPSQSGTELRTKDGRLIYSQTVDLASMKPGPEVRGYLEDSSHVLVVWINYLCPQAVGTRYTFPSADWENAGLLQ
jgi:hypothetical protein